MLNRIEGEDDEKMKKFLIVVVILLVAGFIYYSQQNFFEKGRLRRNLENQIEDTTGLNIKLKETFKSLDNLEDRILKDQQFRNALNDLSEEAREKIQELDPEELERMKKDLEKGAEEYQEVLKDYLGD